MAKSKLQTLQEKRNEQANEIRKQADKFNAAGQKWADDAERSAWETINTEYNATTTEMDAERAASEVSERAAAVAEWQDEFAGDRQTIPGREDVNPGQRQAGSAPTEEQRELTMSAWCRAQMGHDLTNEQREACQATGFNPARRDLSLTLQPGAHSRMLRDMQHEFRSKHPTIAADAALQTRTMSAVTYGSGGALAPESFVRSMEVNMLTFGGMRQVAETMVTSSGEQMTWPTADDTSNTGAQLGESVSIGESVDPSFAGVRWNAYKFTSKPVKVPYELLEDDQFGLASILGAMLGERLGRITNTKFTTGSGASTPKGILTAAELGRTADSPTVIQWDDIIRLEHSVDPAYRTGAGYMAHDAIALALRLLKDGNGQYIWQSGTMLGVPDRLNGGVFTVNQDMPSSVAASAKVLLYGQFSKYKIRRVNQVRVYRMVERYRDNDQDGFVMFLREDGNLLNSGTCPVKYLEMGS